MFRFVISTVCVPAIAEAEDALSLLQHQAKIQKHQHKAEKDGGLCGLGIFTKTKANSLATFKDMLDEFTEKCNSAYEGALCEDIEAELFDGIVKGDLVAEHNDITTQVCEELGALVSAHQEHKDLEGHSDALLQRTQEGAVATDEILDTALSAKGSPRRRRNPPPPPPCHRGHCSNHGNTWDNNANDGCSCSCDSGWGGGVCNVDIKCYGYDCGNHGTTSDMNRQDGCSCNCQAGWAGSSCQ